MMTINLCCARESLQKPDLYWCTKENTPSPNTSELRCTRLQTARTDTCRDDPTSTLVQPQTYDGLSVAKHRIDTLSEQKRGVAH